MKLKWKILAPIDLSRPSEEEVRYALSVATALQSELHLLYVVPSGSSRDFAHHWPPNERNGEDGVIDVHRVVMHGTTAETIVEYADSIDATLILMTSRRYGRWNSFWRKSVTEAVMSLSRRPVFLNYATSAGSDFRFRNGRLLCVADLESSGDTALVRYAEIIAARTVSDVALLHVVPEPTEALLHHAAGGGSRPLSRERATAALNDLSRRLAFPSTTSVMIGNPKKCIELAAREHSVDLVVASRTSGQSQAAYGHDFAGILGRLRCPLLTIPVDARVPAASMDEIRPTLRHRKVVTMAGSAVDQRVNGARHLDEVPIDTTIYSRA